LATSYIFFCIGFSYFSIYYAFLLTRFPQQREGYYLILIIAGYAMILSKNTKEDTNKMNIAIVVLPWSNLHVCYGTTT
jgi:hypothetical protein